MKKTVLMLFLVTICICTAFSQKKYVDFGVAGSNGLFGLAFDTRFSEDSKFGYRIGLSYGFEKNDGVSHLYFTPVKAYFPQDGQMCNYYAVPMNVHYLFGKDKYFLETALGVSVFATNYNFRNDDRVGYFAFAKIAYRYESLKKPLLFTVAIDMPFKTPSSGLGYGFGLIPSISIGYRL